MQESLTSTTMAALRLSAQGLPYKTNSMITATRQDENTVLLRTSMFHIEGVTYKLQVSNDKGQTWTDKGTYDANQLKTGVTESMTKDNWFIRFEVTNGTDTETTHEIRKRV